MIKLTNLLKEIVITDYQLTPKQFDFIKAKGAIKTNKEDTVVLYLPASIVDDLNKNVTNSKFKQEFVDIETGKENMARAILSAIKKSINLGSGVTINSKKYFPLKGHLSKNNNFTFPNPYRVASGTYESKTLSDKSSDEEKQRKPITNLQYYKQLLHDEYSKKVIADIEKNKNTATDRQLMFLKNKVSGNNNYSTKN
jgi:hypothetical protein